MNAHQKSPSAASTTGKELSTSNVSRDIPPVKRVGLIHVSVIIERLLELYGLKADREASNGR
jgi:hypothetical protein